MARTEHLPLPALGHLSHGLLTSPRKRLQPPRQGPRSRMLEANPGSARPPPLHLCLCLSVSVTLSYCHTHDFLDVGVLVAPWHLPSPLAW